MTKNNRGIEGTNGPRTGTIEQLAEEHAVYKDNKERAYIDYKERVRIFDDCRESLTQKLSLEKALEQFETLLATSETLTKLCEEYKFPPVAPVSYVTVAITLMDRAAEEGNTDAVNAVMDSAYRHGLNPESNPLMVPHAAAVEKSKSVSIHTQPRELLDKVKDAETSHLLEINATYKQLVENLDGYRKLLNQEPSLEEALKQFETLLDIGETLTKFCEEYAEYNKTNVPISYVNIAINLMNWAADEGNSKAINDVMNSAYRHGLKGQNNPLIVPHQEALKKSKSVSIQTPKKDFLKYLPPEDKQPSQANSLKGAQGSTQPKTAQTPTSPASGGIFSQRDLLGDARENFGNNDSGSQNTPK